MVTKYIILIIITIRNNIINNSNSFNSKTRNINITDSENRSIVTINAVNKLIYENNVNISNFLNNKHVNVYMT